MRLFTLTCGHVEWLGFRHPLTLSYVAVGGVPDEIRVRRKIQLVERLYDSEGRLLVIYLTRGHSLIAR